jgi:hypothetical protein
MTQTKAHSAPSDIRDLIAQVTTLQAKVAHLEATS